MGAGAAGCWEEPPGQRGQFQATGLRTGPTMAAAVLGQLVRCWENKCAGDMAQGAAAVSARGLDMDKAECAGRPKLQPSGTCLVIKLEMAVPNYAGKQTSERGQRSCCC